jgi:hypothetical protein
MGKHLETYLGRKHPTMIPFWVAFEFFGFNIIIHIFQNMVHLILVQVLVFGPWN